MFDLCPTSHIPQLCGNLGVNAENGKLELNCQVPVIGSLFWEAACGWVGG